MVGGLLVSQALTLFTTPVVYLYLDTFSNALPPKPRGSRLHQRTHNVARSQFSGDGLLGPLSQPGIAMTRFGSQGDIPRPGPRLRITLGSGYPGFVSTPGLAGQ